MKERVPEGGDCATAPLQACEVIERRADTDDAVRLDPGVDASRRVEGDLIVVRSAANRGHRPWESYCPEPRAADRPGPLDRPDLPSAGAGVTPITAIVPVSGNAIFAATGVRLRSKPSCPDGPVG